MRWLRSKYHALSSLRAPQPYPPSTYKDTTTRIPSISSIRALPHKCSLATPNITMSNKTHVGQGAPTPGHHLECRTFDPFTRSPVALSPPAHLNPTLRLTCPTCGHNTCSRQNMNCLDPVRHTMSHCESASKPLPVVRPTLGPIPGLTNSIVWASLSHSPQLKYSHWSMQPPCATCRRVHVCGSVVFCVRGQSGLAP
jgi:hypothetical protein